MYERDVFYSKLLLILLPLSAYFVAVMIGNQLFANIVSPIVVFIASYFTLITAKNHSYRLNWILVFLMAFSWGTADIGWLISSSIFGLNPEKISAITYLYSCANIFLAITVIVYFLKNIKKWHRVQLLLDAMVTSTAIIALLWNIIFKNIYISQIGMNDFIINTILMSMDVISLSIGFIMYSSARVTKITNTLKLILSATTAFALTDIFYIFLYLHNRYVPNSLIDFAYVSSFVLFAIAAIHEIYRPTQVTERKFLSEPENMGKSYNSLLLLILPFILYFVGYLPIAILILIIIAVLVHLALSAHVQKSITNEHLLKQERYMNEQLEVIIAKRTEELVTANEILDELSKIDTLTGLYNRRHFLKEIDRMISSSGISFCVMYMDLDRFKVINDTHGHEMGDKVLTVIAERLKKWLPDAALLARLGGDEFVITMKNLNQESEIEKICKEIMELIEQPIIINSYIFHLEVSIGVSRFPLDTRNRDQLLKYADIAMYDAKKDYYSMRCILYNAHQSNKIERKNEIEILMRNVDFDKEFELYYQPQFNLADNQLVGMEALLRWKNPSMGFISPAEFIPIAEETGLILDIGKWVIEKAVSQIRSWNIEYNKNLVIGINISPMQMNSIDFIKDIEKLFEDYSVSTEWIDFEITESSAMNTYTAMEEIFAALSSIGIRISIDDFGTGYSSLSYIKRFDIDKLKIAKELIDNIADDINEKLIVKAIIMMAKGMGLTTIAEGVETEKQLEILKALECDEIQGYIKGKPVPAYEFEKSFLADKC